MSTSFLVPRHKIGSVNIPDPNLELFLLEYCEEHLDIPLFLIHHVQYVDDGIAVELCRLEDWMVGEPWYVGLVDIAEDRKAA